MQAGKGSSEPRGWGQRAGGRGGQGWAFLRQHPRAVPVTAGSEELIHSCSCQWLSISLGEHKVMFGMQLDPPLFQKGLKLWVDVRSYDHGGPFPVGLASLVVSRAMPDDPTALLVFEEGLPNLQLAYGALPEGRQHAVSTYSCVHVDRS